MKKVAFVHDIFPGGGAERVTVDIARYVSQHSPDHRFFVFTPRFVEELYTDEMKQYLTVKVVRREHDERNCDIERLVVSEGIDILIQVVQPLRDIEGIRARTGCKVVFCNHGEPFWERYTIIRRRQNSLFFKPLWKLLWKRYFVDNNHAAKVVAKRVRRVYNACDAYTVLCADYKDEIAKGIGVEPENSRIVVIENSEQIVANVNYDKEKILLYCGRLENTAKRLDRLLRIWGRVQHALPDYRLVIVGDGGYRADMEHQIEQEQLERVEMVGRHSNVEQFYQKASIVCLTSQTEGWGLCLTEGQAHGCIPIAFGCSSGVKDILSPSGVNGFIVTPFDEDEYAQTLLHIASMSDQEREVIRHNVVEKRAQYSPDVILKKWADLIHSLTC